jgi:hypothetical protein
MAVLGTTLLPNRIALACIDDRNQRESETRRREQQLESRNYGIARFCRQCWHAMASGSYFQIRMHR